MILELISVICALTLLIGFSVEIGRNMGYREGFSVGVVYTLTEVQGKLAEKGVTLDWTRYENGTYEVKVYVQGVLYAQGKVKYDLYLTVTHNGLATVEHGSGVLTTIGKSFIEQQIVGTVNATQKALYEADSNTNTGYSSASTQLTDEITVNGLDRQLGTYTHTGAANSGTFNITVTKTVTGTQSTQAWALHWKSYAESPDNCMIAYDITPSQKNCVAGDTVQETWQGTIS